MTKKLEFRRVLDTPNEPRIIITEYNEGEEKQLYDLKTNQELGQPFTKNILAYDILTMCENYKKAGYELDFVGFAPDESLDLDYEG